MFKKIKKLLTKEKEYKPIKIDETAAAFDPQDLIDGITDPTIPPNPYNTIKPITSKV